MFEGQFQQVEDTLGLATDYEMSYDPHIGLGLN
jgi:hypothetical protein